MSQFTRNITYILLSTLAPMFGADFTVPSGSIEITAQTLTDDGDKGLVEEGGVIVIGAIAVTMSGDNQLMLNEGVISTTENFAHGIFNSVGQNSTITNRNQILTTGFLALGIFTSDGDNVVITNSGVISTTGAAGFGIFNNLGNNDVIINSGIISTIGPTNSWGIITQNSLNTKILNSGWITTTGGNGWGIYNNISTNAQIINTGRITTTGATSHAIYNNAASNNSVVLNSGLLSTTEADSYGIFNQNSNDIRITNSGKIFTQGVDSYGIYNDSGNTVIVVNSGTIKTDLADAIRFETGTDPTLILLRGSNLQGAVFSDNALDLAVETGLNLALTLDSAGASFDSFAIEAPFIHLGDTVGVIDPTGLAMQADVVADLSDAILNGIYRYRTAFPCKCIPCQSGVWAQGIGSYRERSHKKGRVGYDNWQGGVLVGYQNSQFEGNLRLFGGVSFGRAEVDQHTQKADTISYVGGLVCERAFWNTFLGLALTAGYTNWDNERYVMNNLAPGGVESARANTGGLFISSDASIAHRFTSLWCCPVMSFSLRYAGLIFDNFSETGSLSNFSTNFRKVDLLTTRLELSTPFTTSENACRLSVEPYLGVAGRYQLGGNHVSGELLEQPLSFAIPSSRNLAIFLGGTRAIYSYNRCNLFFNIEGSHDTSRSTRILGEGGVGFNF